MKRCPFCAEEIQDAAIKCRHCGSMLAGPGADAAGIAAPVPAAAVAAPAVRDVAAVPIYEGAPSWKAQFWSNVGAGLVALAGVAAAVALPVAAITTWSVGAITGGALLVAGIAWWGYLTLVRRSLYFRISTRTIDVESGIFSKRIDTLQLWKVRDIEFSQTLLDRMLNVARIRVFTHDVTTPELHLWGMPESRETFDRLKNSIEIARQARNVVGVVE